MLTRRTLCMGFVLTTLPGSAGAQVALNGQSNLATLPSRRVANAIIESLDPALIANLRQEGRGFVLADGNLNFQNAIAADFRSARTFSIKGVLLSRTELAYWLAKAEMGQF